MKNHRNILKGHIIVFDDSDGSNHPVDITLAQVEAEFYDKYYSLILRFPDGTWKKFWFSQNTRLPKLGKAR